MASSSKRMRFSNLKDEITAKVTRTVPGPPEAVLKIVDHLLSPQVGVTCVEDLKHLTLQMLPGTVVAPIKAVQLLAQFHAASSSGEHGGEGPSSRSDSRDEVLVDITPANREINMHRDMGGYSFNLPWSALPKTTLDNLAANEQNKERAKQDDIDALKLSIVKKLVSSYNSYKEDHPGQKKHPGMKIYKSITEQCFSKYGFALADVVNGKQVGDGKAGFTRAILICTENQMRQKGNNNTATISRAVREHGIVGVLPDKYLPHIAIDERSRLEEIRAELCHTHEGDCSDWNWESIKERMEASYHLQREDVINAKDQVVGAAEAENENPDEPEAKAVEVLREQWPFLFTVSGLKWHHNALTNRTELSEQLKEFIDNHLDSLCLYLTACSKSNTKNIALNLKLEKKIKKWTPGNKLIKCVNMIANHFNESYEVLLHNVEKTTERFEIDTKGLKDLCIIAHDKQPLAADNFFIVTDEVIMVETYGFLEALTCLLQLAFILDLEYPQMPLTFEFLERFVFGLGIPDTKVKSKKGKRILVLTPAVRDLINGLKDFEENIADSDND